MSHPPSVPAFRSGFACLAGRPNVGKSTLTNALVGAKVAITSDRPQTTRRVIRGIVHRPDAQLILVDTPGLHKPRTLLGERLDSLVRSTLAEVDVIGFCVPATDPVGPGDRFFARELENVKKTPVVVVVTKCDGVPPERVAEQLMAVSELGDWADVVPVSAVTGFQLDVLADVLVSHLPPGVPLYLDGELTDEPEQIMVAELIREAALDGVRDELPHSIAVVVEEMGPRPGRDDLTDGTHSTLLLAEQLVEHRRVDARHGDMRADAVDDERAEQKQQTPLQVRVPVAALLCWVSGSQRLSRIQRRSGDASARGFDRCARALGGQHA